MKEKYTELCHWGHNRMIYVLTLLCLLLSVSVTGISAQAARVDDGADLLTDGEESKLQNRLEEFVEKYDCDIVVTTTDSTDGKTPMRYADDYYEGHEYGIGPDHDGLMLLISMEDRDWYIGTYGMAIQAFTDYGIQEIGDIITDPLGDGEYYEAFMEFADLADTFVAEYQNGTPYDVDHTYSVPMGIGTRLLISLAAGLVVVLIVFLILRGQLKSVGYEREAVDYVRRGSFHLRKEKDLFLYKTVTRTKIEKSSSSGGGGSSTHSTSSGGTAGGGGGKF